MIPFIFQRKLGLLPPFNAFAVKETLVPAQTLIPGEALILTEGTTLGITVMVILLLVAFSGTAHDSLLVISQVIISPFTIELVVYEVLFVPTLMPFFFH